MSLSKRRWPVRNVAITASHELFPSPQAALAETIRDRLVRRVEIRQQHQLGRRWCPYAVESTRLNRSLDGGIDDIKFLYPVLDNIPVLVLTLLNFASAGVRICLYGSPEICRVAGVVRDYLLEIGWIRDRDELLTVEEDREHISYFNSFKRSTDSLGVRAEGAIVWTAGDLVMAYDVWPWLLEPDIDQYHLVVNMLARELIFPPGTKEVLRLEYFDSLCTPGEQRAREVRQPDMLVFTGAGRDALANLALIRGKPEADLLAIFLRTTWRGLFGRSASAILRAVHYGLQRKLYTLTPGRGLSVEHASAVASVFFGVPTVVNVKSGDPFIIKDADGFEEVFGFYRTMLQGIVDAAPTREVGYARLAAYYPHAEHLFRLSGRLEPLWGEIPLWRRWTEFIRDKTETYNRALSAAFEVAGVGDGTQPIPHYFDSKGAFQYQPSPAHSDIPGSLEYLTQTYRPRYERGREHHAHALESPRGVSQT